LLRTAAMRRAPGLCVYLALPHRYDIGRSESGGTFPPLLWQ
jgi:hypothetical protein